MEISVQDKINIKTSKEVDPDLLRMLGLGIDDVASGRVITHNDAIKEIERIRCQSKGSSQF